MQYVYILRSQKDESVYVGMTSNLKQRLAKHNSQKVKSTKSKAPYKIIWYCAFPLLIQAVRLEKYLKTGSGIAFGRKHLIN